MSGNGSPLQLAYFFSPDTIGATAAGANPSVLNLTVMISNPGLVAVAVTHITVEIPTGQEISGDISTATGLPGPVYDTAIPWSIAASGNTVTVRPSQGSAAPVTGPILFSLPGIQVNETPGTVYPVITEFYPPPTPKATDGSTYTLVKLPSDAPVTSFLVTPSVLTNLDAPVTLSWTCSAQGQQDSFGLRVVSSQSVGASAGGAAARPRPPSPTGRSPAAPTPAPKQAALLQLNGCGTSGECYTAAQGAAGIPYGPVDQTTTFALDVFRAEGSGRLAQVATYHATVQVVVPSIAQESFVTPSPTGQFARAHWLAYNATSCSVVVDGKTVLTGAPTDTYANGYPLLLGSTPSPHVVEVVAHGVNQQANASLMIGEVAVTSVQPFPVGGDPGQVLITPQGTVGFVLNSGHGPSVSSIFLQTTPPTAGSPIQAGASATVMGLTPNGQHLVIVAVDANWVAIVDAASFKVVATLDNVAGGFSIACTPDNAFALIASVTTANVYCVDLVAGALTRTITTVHEPMAIAITPDGSLALTLSAANGDVGVIDVPTLQAEPTPIPVGIPWGSITITPDGSTAIVVNGSDGGLSLIDIPTRSVVATLPTGASPAPATCTPDGSLAFIPNQGSPYVTVIDLANRSVAASVTVSGSPAAVAITPDGLLALVTLMGNAVTAIDIPSLTASPISMPVGSGPFNLALAPTGLQALIACTNDNTAWVI